jgi:PII-like signaling protein
MNGYQITFFTQQGRRVHGQPVGEWLMKLTQELGLRGATLQAADEGLGRAGKVHSAHFFELADQPIEVVTIMTGEEADRRVMSREQRGITESLA